MKRTSDAFAARVAYDGTGYYGFQRQKAGTPTVQAVLEAALAELAGEPVGLQAAGRTDAGVHATGQVIAFALAWKHSMPSLRGALNARLPDDVVVRAVWPRSLHPRFDATLRRYVYRVYHATVPDPLRRHRAWWLASPVDLTTLHAAAAMLVGEHDFRSFGTPPVGTITIRRVQEAFWEPAPNGELRFTIAANAFLYRMVRRIVGASVAVGQGRMRMDDFHARIHAPDSKLVTAMAPAHGLTLVDVEYD
ncbi:MAG: tRNA pseudouridine(38-40) synthase TruA [Anaerolineae bacterium]